MALFDHVPGLMVIFDQVPVSALFALFDQVPCIKEDFSYNLVFSPRK